MRVSAGNRSEVYIRNIKDLFQEAVAASQVNQGLRGQASHGRWVEAPRSGARRQCRGSHQASMVRQGAVPLQLGTPPPRHLVGNRYHINIRQSMASRMSGSRGLHHSKSKISEEGVSVGNDFFFAGPRGREL